MNYYNGSEILTAGQLAALGYIKDENSIDLNRLSKIGFLPVQYNHPVVPDTYAELPDEMIHRGDHYERSFKIVDAPLEVARTQLLERVAEKRWEAETGGIEINGVRVSTDRQSQAMITQTVAGLNLVNSTEDKIETVRFKSESGFVDLTPAQIMAIGIGVTRHVEKCYTREAELCEEIQTAPNLETLRSIDLSFNF